MTTFIKKFLKFVDHLLMNEIELLSNTNNNYQILAIIKKFLDVERVYCFIYWGYANYFTDTLNASRQDMLFGGNKKPNKYSVHNETLSNSHIANSISRLEDSHINFSDSIARVESK